MTLRYGAVAALALILAAAAGRGQDPAPDRDPYRVHIRMHQKTAPKVVFVRAPGQSGTGVIVRNDGYIVTSPTACGYRSSTATVILPGYRKVDAKVVGRVNDLELVVLKVDVAGLSAMEFADSTKARLGQIAYTFGDVFQSIDTDDQVAMTLGIVSGTYEVTTAQPTSLYTGPVIETSAAVNQNQDGGPLVDAEGRMLGLITLNYHPAKFTGIAVPAHVLKPEVDRLIKEHASGVVRKGKAWIGISVEDGEGLRIGVKIVGVTPGSPAATAGLKVGDQLVRIDADRVRTIDDFDAFVENLRPDDRLRLRVRRNGTEQDFRVTVGTKKVVY